MAFSDVTRLKILEFLRDGEKCATFLREKINTGQSTLSHHMKILIESGVVIARKEGKWTYYSICENGRRYATRLLGYLTSKVKRQKADAGYPPEAAHTLCCIPDNFTETKNNNATDISKEKRRPDTVKPFTIVVDTSCDLSPEFIDEHGIEVMPIPFMLDGVEHGEGYWQNISGKQFYDALRNGSTAKTSQINPDAFVKSFAEHASRGNDVIYLILSGGLSATYQSSQIALDEVRETYPDCNIYTIDSISATAVSTLLTLLAVSKRNEGLSAKEAAAWLEERKNYLIGIFTVDDLMYLHRGGRLSKLSAVGGSLLGIKPILCINPDGSLGLKDKVRGRDAALRMLLSQMEKSVAPNSVIERLLIPHTDCLDDARKLADMARDKFEIRQLDIVLMGPVIGAHVGPGTVALVFEGNLTREEFERKQSDS